MIGTRTLAKMVALVCVWACTLAVPVAAQRSPGTDGATFSNSNPLPGEEVTVSGTTDALAVTDISATVDVTLTATTPAAQNGTQVLGSTVPSEDGEFSVTVVIPATLGAGSYLVEVVAGTSVLASTTVVVEAVPTPTDQPSLDAADAADALAYTGRDVEVPIAAGVSLLIAGGVVLSFVRCRQQA